MFTKKIKYFPGKWGFNEKKYARRTLNNTSEYAIKKRIDTKLFSNRKVAVWI